MAFVGMLQLFDLISILFQSPSNSVSYFTDFFCFTTSELPHAHEGHINDLHTFQPILNTQIFKILILFKLLLT